MSAKEERNREDRVLPESAFLAVGALLNSPELSSLDVVREMVKGGIRVRRDKFDELFNLMEVVYYCYEPIVGRLSWSRLRHLAYYNASDVAEEFGIRRLRLWEIIVLRFNWSNYLDLDSQNIAPVALLKYIIRALGGKSIYLGDLQLGERIQHFNEDHYRGGGSDSTLEAVLGSESGEQLGVVFAEWQESTNSSFVEALVDRYVNGLSLEEIAEKTGVRVGVVKARISRAKGLLVKKLRERRDLRPVWEGGVIYKDSRWSHHTRLELLDSRRRQLMIRLPAVRHLIPPKALRALEIFYGLDESEPVYDFAETARIGGLSESSVRVDVSKGLRLALGKEPFSKRAVNDHYERGLYDYWLRHQIEMALPEQQVQVLEMYFGKKLSLAAIAKELGISAEKARRKKIQALNFIMQISSYREKD